MTEVFTVDNSRRGNLTCPACGLVEQHQQMLSAHQRGWWKWKRWVALYRCVSCAAPFEAQVPQALPLVIDDPELPTCDH